MTERPRSLCGSPGESCSTGARVASINVRSATSWSLAVVLTAKCVMSPPTINVSTPHARRRALEIRMRECTRHRLIENDIRRLWSEPRHNLGRLRASRFRARSQGHGYAGRRHAASDRAGWIRLLCLAAAGTPAPPATGILNAPAGSVVRVAVVSRRLFAVACTIFRWKFAQRALLCGFGPAISCNAFELIRAALKKWSVINAKFIQEVGLWLSRRCVALGADTGLHCCNAAVRLFRRKWG